MKNWLECLQQTVDQGEPCILVSIVDAHGSTPREVGAKMIVTEGDAYATIGGGRFEYDCIEVAREMLRLRQLHKVQRYSLGPSLGQCCGGVAEVAFDLIAENSEWVLTLIAQQRHSAVVLASIIDQPGYGHHRWVVSERGMYGTTDAPTLDDQVMKRSQHLLATRGVTQSAHLTDTSGREVVVLLEPIYPHALDIVLFGAGHIGQALVRLLADLPCHVNWVDSRQNLFPANLPVNIDPVVTPAPESEVDHAPSEAYFLVMTHSHPLDQVICERILSKDDFRYCGLIGSKSKRKKFEKRFLAHGIPATVIEKLTCPIGIDGISGKHPAEIAIAVAAQLMQVHEQYEDRLTQTFSPKLVAG